MQSDVILNKVASIERCVARVREEYQKDILTFATDYTRQDAALLNIQRACELCIDIGQHIIRKENLGLSQSARDVFAILAQHHKIPTVLAQNLQNMVGFRNIVVHSYQQINMVIVIAVIEQRLDDFLQFTQALLPQYCLLEDKIC
ncbi:MAG: DUF86 domain-containing protein [Acinetobacter sp.]|nr:MAG: DUF86 domain-containing protein [Acinetobacter sp.]